jgi:superfamily II DNA or RNA helicase
MKVVVSNYAWMQKSDLTSDQLAALRRALTVMPKKVGDHPGDAPSPIPLFSENAATFGLPRQFFLGRRKQNHEVEFKVTEGDKSLWPGPLTFVGTLRTEQAAAVAKVVSLFRAGLLGGIVRAVPGWGKTVYACALMAELQVPTLVVVHKSFLLDQWRERILGFMPGAKIGLAQGPECDFKGRHVVLGMVESLCEKNYGEEFYKQFGLVISDEVHRIGAATWARVPPQFDAKWRLGLSATPRRKDGADAVFHHHIGEVIFAAKEVRMKPKIRRVWIPPDIFKLFHTANFNPSLVKKTLLLKFMCASPARNRVITDQLILALKAGRKCLVLSERLQHLRDLETALYKQWADADGPHPSVGYYIGGQKKEELDEAAKARVILATSQLVQEGLDIPAMDTIFLTTPLSDIEQAVGRILRPCDGKKEPVVVDFREDHISICAKYGKYRDEFYRKAAWDPPGLDKPQIT